MCGLPSLKIKKPSPNFFKNSRSITQGGVQLNIMSDKDMTERHVLSEQFPQSKLLMLVSYSTKHEKSIY